MKVRLRAAQTRATVGELDLQPSQVRRLSVIDYLGTEYTVVSQFTTVIDREVIAIVDVREVGR